MSTLRLLLSGSNRPRVNPSDAIDDRRFIPIVPATSDADDAGADFIERRCDRFLAAGEAL